jgi:predicted ATPase
METLTAGQALEIAGRSETNTEDPWAQVQKICRKIVKEAQRDNRMFYDLTDEETYEAHSKLVLFIANEVCMKKQNRKFEIDDNNKDVLRFLLYYFNNCQLAEEVFPERGYKLHKHLLIQGNVGTGKTMLMQIFSEYLRRTNNPRFFYNLSVTQMVNYYTIHNNLDKFTYNEEENKGFQCSPMNICLNDIGIQAKTFFGMNTKLLTDEFLHARNEIWVQYGNFAHITTNLTIEQIKDVFADGYGRLVDRFKTYNVIPLYGSSRR